MKKIRSKIKDQKGSITLLALTTMLMFTTIVVVVYVNINYKGRHGKYYGGDLPCLLFS